MIASIVVIGLTVWKCYPQIQLKVFLKCGIRLPDCKRNNHKFIAKGILEYDAFLCSTGIDNDVDQFVEEWKARLNPDDNLSLCLHYIDFLPGNTISDSIDNAISSSRNVIVFLTRKFCESDWCRYEFEQAHHKAVRDDSFKLIIILVEAKSEFHNVRHSLIRKYLANGRFLRIGDLRFWDKFQALVGK